MGRFRFPRRYQGCSCQPSTYRDVTTYVRFDGRKHWGPEAIWEENEKRGLDFQGSGGLRTGGVARDVLQKRQSCFQVLKRLLGR